MRITAVLSIIISILLPIICTAQDKLGVAVAYLPSRIEPFALEDPVQRIILSQLGYGLTRRGKNSSTELELAEKLERTANGSSWKCVLKRGVRFPTGVELSAEDVKASFDFYRSRAEYLSSAQMRDRLISSLPPVLNGQRSVHPRISDFLLKKLANIRSVEVTAGPRNDANSVPMGVVFLLTEPDDEFDQVVLSLPIVNMTLARNLGTDFGYGSLVPLVGPYQIAELKPGVSLRLEATTVYSSEPPSSIREVEFKVYEDARSALSALRGGSVSVIALPTRDQFLAIEPDPTVTKLNSPLKNLGANLTWNLGRRSWGSEETETDLLTEELIIARESLDMGQRGEDRFEFSEAKFTLDQKTF